MYSVNDTKLEAGINYYRVKITDQNLVKSYSKIVKLIIDPVKPSFVLYPNPMPIINKVKKEQNKFNFIDKNSLIHLY
mgnify:CR=1 FL=1